MPRLIVSNKHSGKSQMQCSSSILLHTAVQLQLGNATIANNTVVLITDIGNARSGDGDALICSTTLTPCCASVNNCFGEWYYPSGDPLGNDGSGDDIFRGRRDYDASPGELGSVRLHRRNDVVSPVGLYGCVIPDASGVNQNLYVGIYTTSDNSEYVYLLSCACAQRVNDQFSLLSVVCLLPKNLQISWF